jgi:cytochrome c biogenesis protein CcmG, thiol:disulfide interchange protein DsbE
VRPLCLVVGLLVGFGCASTPAPKPNPGGPVDFSLPIWPTSQQHSFADDRGHIVVLDAWATWCTPCQAQLPQLDALAKQWAPQGVRVYAVSIDTNVQAVQPFLLTFRVDLPILLDPGGEVLKQMLGLQNMPTTWVFDGAGHLVFTEQGSAALIAEKVNLMLTAPAKP